MSALASVNFTSLTRSLWEQGPEVHGPGPEVRTSCQLQ